MISIIVIPSFPNGLYIVSVFSTRISPDPIQHLVEFGMAIYEQHI